MVLHFVMNEKKTIWSNSYPSQLLLVDSGENESGFKPEKLSMHAQVCYGRFQIYCS